MFAQVEVKSIKSIEHEDHMATYNARSKPTDYDQNEQCIMFPFSGKQCIKAQAFFSCKCDFKERLLYWFLHQPAFPLHNPKKFGDDVSPIGLVRESGYYAQENWPNSSDLKCYK